MKKFIFLLSILLSTFLLISSLPLPSFSFAQSEQEKLQKLNDQINEYQKQVVLLQNQANTLSNQIAQFDAQISLTQLRINKTEEEIGDLGGRIDELETSLGSLSNAFSNRVVETYKMARVGEPILLLLSSTDVTQAVSRYHYLRKIQQADRDLMLKLQRTQNVYVDQKSRLEKLQEQLETQKKELDNQKKAKANLLQVTKNDEKKYQQLLSATRAEIEAIQAIIAGRGEESEVGPIAEGSKIASIIQGPSCNSNGAHLHFIVSENGQTKNPFSYLKSIDYENCSGSSCGSNDGDPFSPSGSWNWPISPRVSFSQGYGSTWAVRNSWVGRIYQFHNGIDIDSESSPDVRAVQGGILFRGSYGGSNSCRLRYVRVDHANSNLDTFYLHVNY